MTKLYIAYGSNLNIGQMKYRCPEARPYAVGILKNWKLVFRGQKTNSHATIIRRAGSVVPVLVWKITERDEFMLDRYEGYPTYYFKKNIMVHINGRKKLAMVYIMNASRQPGIPSLRYSNVIKQGYIDNDLDLSILNDALKYNLTECM